MKSGAIFTVLALATATNAAAEPYQWRWGAGQSLWSSCGIPGITCAKTKRAALAVADALAQPDAEAYKWRWGNGQSLWSSCGVPGMTCAKARRHLEELGDKTAKTLDNVLSLDKDDHAIQQRNYLVGHGGFPRTQGGAEIGQFAGFGGFPKGHAAKREANANPEAYQWRWGNGQSLWSSCGIPGITCAKAKRGIELIKEDFGNIHKDECFAPGGECHAVLRARAAFDEAIKNEPSSTDAPWLACTKPGMSCSPDVYNFAVAKLVNATAADQALEDCHKPNGDCTKAQQYLDELDAALTKATEEVLKLN